MSTITHFIRSSTLMKCGLFMRWHCVKATENKDLFVPSCGPVNQLKLEQLQQLLNASSRLLILTGAGVSTESGIPDYRSAGIGLYAKTNRRPVQHQDFIRFASARQRYWARNFVGWPRFSSFLPNPTHQCLADWEKRDRLDYLITQNVDKLHHRAGSQRCIELHGTSHTVACLSCHKKLSRFDFQQILSDANPAWNVEWLQEQLAPDGDVLLPDDEVQRFVVPPCSTCEGILKPDLVFFGDNVATSLVKKVYEMVDNCDLLLVLGSSLFVYSGYRFVLHAHQHGKKIAIVNIGSTRADDLALVKIDGRCSRVLSMIER